MTPVFPFQFCSAMICLGCCITARWNLDTAMSKAHCRASTAGQPHSWLTEHHDHQLHRASAMRATAQRFVCPLEAVPGRIKLLTLPPTEAAILQLERLVLLNAATQIPHCSPVALLTTQRLLRSGAEITLTASSVVTAERGEQRHCHTVPRRRDRARFYLS